MKTSRMKGAVQTYQKMYDTIKDWDKNGFLYDLGWGIGDMAWFGWTGDEGKNEKECYEAVLERYRNFKNLLAFVLGHYEEVPNEEI